MIELGTSFNLTYLQLPSGSVPLTLQWIPPESFSFGEPGMRLAGYGQPISVTLTTGFWLGTYPITQGHWQAIMETKSSLVYNQKANFPVAHISWHDAMALCDILTQQLRATLPAGYAFRLPAEVQWEYACRAMATTRYYNGDTLRHLDEIAWHAGNSQGMPQPVGQKVPNRWGLYDMIGNGFEWCFDRCQPYPIATVVDWVGQSDYPYYVIRGGSWNSPADSETLWSSTNGDPGAAHEQTKSPWIGMRLCLCRQSFNDHNIQL